MYNLIVIICPIPTITSELDNSLETKINYELDYTIPFLHAWKTKQNKKNRTLYRVTNKTFIHPL